MTRILVIGATGYIGRTLLARAGGLARGTSSTPTEGLLHLQLGAPLAFDYSQIDDADTVLMTAAISAPDVCAREKDRAWNINVTGTSAFIERAMHRGARIIFFSSDTVYGDQATPFTESGNANPAGEYAEMKAAVENLFRSERNFKSARLSYVFSRNDKFTSYLKNCWNREEIAEVFHPFFRSVVHRDDVISGALSLADRWAQTPEWLINFGGPQTVSRVDFAKALRDTCLPDLGFVVTEPEATFFHNRPRCIAMQSPIFAKLLGRAPRGLREAAQFEFPDLQPPEPL